MRETKQAAASPEARAAMHELMAAFEAFKGANDARLAEIEKKASADTLLEEKVARIDAAVAGAQARLDRVVSEARRPAMEGAVVAAPEAKAAWDAYLRSGTTPSTTSWSPSPRGGGLVVKAGLDSGSGSGGLIAPAETERLVERRLMAASPMREIATVRTVASGVFRKPVSTDGIEAGWAAETAVRPETEGANLSLLEFPSAELYASPAATQTLLDDAFMSLDEWLAGEIEDAFAAQETEAFVNGDGTNKPRGFLTYPTAADNAWGQIGHVLTGADGAFGEAPVDRLIDLIYAPKAKYRANGRFVMNRRTASAIRKFKDADGNYVWSPATQPGATSSLLGYPVTEIEETPNIGADALAVAFGDFRRGYLIVDRAGLSVLRDPYSAKPYVLFYTTKRVGGGVQDFDAIKVLKFAES
ncbi:phage major capsid protein [Brevundimonas sp.]|uniref:phage major capsid protein n=1 Tax=Brevundimonas sp. TaxID=1871086 RepID=UPI0039E67DEE